MVINFNHSLQQALEDINFQGQYQEYVIHEDTRERCEHTDSELIEKYGDAKWNVVDVLNKEFSTVLGGKFDLYNWLHHKEEDEVAYFLNEGGSNTLNYSQFKAPHSFRVWLGSKGFVIGIQQMGKGFNAWKVNDKELMSNEGAAFDFFRRCNNVIFFDDAENTKIVFMEAIVNVQAQRGS